jgi:hypothetical protein
MPRGDRTGPAGMEPMSGRAAGYCGAFENSGLGRGRGWGFGRGGGCRGRDAEAERRVLRCKAEALRARLRAIESRLEGHEPKEKPE